jgi:hypothetical protein
MGVIHLKDLIDGDLCNQGRDKNSKMFNIDMTIHWSKHAPLFSFIEIYLVKICIFLNLPTHSQ